MTFGQYIEAEFNRLNANELKEEGDINHPFLHAIKLKDGLRNIFGNYPVKNYDEASSLYKELLSPLALFILSELGEYRSIHLSENPRKSLNKLLNTFGPRSLFPVTKENLEDIGKELYEDIFYTWYYRDCVRALHYFKKDISFPALSKEMSV